MSSLDTPGYWNRRLTHLTQIGMSIADAAVWATASPGIPADAVALQARGYFDVGFGGGQAVAWWQAWIMPPRAVVAAMAGWRPEEVTDLQALLPAPLRWSPGQTTDRPAGGLAWIQSRIVPQRCLAYLRAGCTLQHAQKLELRRAAGDPSVASALDLLGALRE